MTTLTIYTPSQEAALAASRQTAPQPQPQAPQSNYKKYLIAAGVGFVAACVLSTLAIITLFVAAGTYAYVKKSRFSLIS